MIANLYLIFGSLFAFGVLLGLLKRNSNIDSGALLVVLTSGFKITVVSYPGSQGRVYLNFFFQIMNFVLRCLPRDNWTSRILCGSI